MHFFFLILMMKKLKNTKLPLWFPYPSSWLKSLILAYFSMGIALSIDLMDLEFYFVSILEDKRELLVVLSLGILLFPIPAIAILHHLLSLFFQSLIPRLMLPTLKGALLMSKKLLPLQYKSKLKRKKQLLKLPKTNNYPTTILPTFINWWEGLYSWLVLSLSTMISVIIYTLLLPWFDLNYQILSFNYKHFWQIDSLELLFLWISFALIWISTAAILYQIEHLFKLKFSNKFSLNYENDVDIYRDIDWGKVLITVDINESDQQDKTSSIDIHVRLPEPVSQRKIAKIYLLNRGQIKSKNYIFLKAVLIFLIFSVLAPRIYKFYLNYRQENLVAGFSELSNSQVVSPKRKELETTPSPVVSKSPEKPSRNPSPTTVLLPPDPFTMAVNRATSASEMTQLANSRIEWEAVASQWQDAVELMKLVPAFHPNYRVARQKAIEYQNNANYARRVAANSK